MTEHIETMLPPNTLTDDEAGNDDEALRALDEHNPVKFMQCSQQRMKKDLVTMYNVLYHANVIRKIQRLHLTANKQLQRSTSRS